MNPETKKESEDIRQIVISVPFLEILAPTLTISQPVEGTTYGNGAISVEGTTTNAKTVTLTTAFLGEEGSTATPKPGSSPAPGPTRTIDVAEDQLVRVPAAGADHGPLGDHGHRHVRAGPDRDADPEHHGRLQRA